MEMRDDVAGQAGVCAASPVTTMRLSTRAADAVAADEDSWLRTQLLTGDCFTVLGQRAQIGRLLTPADDRDGAPLAVVVSDRFWARRFARSPDALGRLIAINGSDFTIVGVTAPGFGGTRLELEPPEAWMSPMVQPHVRYGGAVSFDGTFNPDRPWPPQRGLAWLQLLVRVPDPARAAGVSARLHAMMQREELGRLTASSNASARARTEARRFLLAPAASGIGSWLREDTRRPLLLLSAFAGLLLLIACANLAGLLLARASGRQREMAVRLSMGASRARLARQLLTESAVLAAIGGALGLWLAGMAAPALLGLLAGGAGTVETLDLRPAPRVLAFSIGITIATALLCGLLPALRGTRVALGDALKTQARGLVGGAGFGGRFRFARAGASGRLPFGRLLVVSQIALAVLLLIVSGLFVRSLREIARVSTGIDEAQLVVGRVDPRAAGFGPEVRPLMQARVIERLRQLPGVSAVSLSMNGPMAGIRMRSSFVTAGYQPAPDETPTVQVEIVTPDHFRALGVSMRRGRAFSEQDRTDSRPVAIINDALARRYFAGRDPVGQRFGRGPREPQVEIVGVVRDAHYNGRRDEPPALAYRPAAQTDDVLTNLEVRVAGPAGVDASHLLPAIRAAVREVAPGLPISSLQTFSTRAAAETRGDRALAALTTACGAAALLLACLGLYGTMAYAVARRTNEIGIRLALGADRGHVRRLMLGEAAGSMIAGLLVGLLLAAFAGRAIGAMLYGITPGDLTAHAGGVALLLAVTGAAAWLPARRAARLDPMAALRRE